MRIAPGPRCPWIDASIVFALVFFTSVSAGAAPGESGAGGRMSLDALATELGLDASWDPVTRSGFFRRLDTYAVFAVGAPWILWNWKESETVDPPLVDGRGVTFSAGFAKALRSGLARSREPSAHMFKVKAILIDPGHGGKDTGAIGEHRIDGKTLRLLEKNLNLTVALRIHRELEKKYPDRQILLTRHGDTFPTLEERVEKANSQQLADTEAIIYVSIHANASFNRSARGFEVWYLNPEYRRTVVDAELEKRLGEDIAPIMNAMLEEEFTTESVILARQILGRMEKAIGKQSPNRGLRAEEWFVVRNARMPSVLIETGFITNSTEAVLLSQDAYLFRIADAIYNGIVDFVTYFENR